MPSDLKDHLVVLGKKNLPETGVILIPNVLRFHDLLLLERELQGRKVTYLIERGCHYDPLLQAHLEKEGVSALEFDRSPEQQDVFRRQAHADLANREVLVFVPGLTAARVGAPTTVPADILRFLVETGGPVQPLHVDHPDDALLSIEVRPRKQTIVFSFGKVLEREAANVPNYWEQLLVAGHDAYALRGSLDLSLGYALICGLKKHGAQNHVITAEDGTDQRFDRLLPMAIVLAKHLREETSKARVGIVLPPSFGGLLANVAVVLAGKTPVNLNFTASEESIRSAMEQADVDRLITADPFVRRTQRFPWPPNRQIIFLERLLPALKGRITRWFFASKLMSARAIARALGLSPKGGDREAVLLFTSGSSGEPKGVMLSHRNVLANVLQFSTRLQLRSHDSALGCLPLFHSFGCTVTLWYPVIEGVNLVTHPNPIEAHKLAAFIRQFHVTLLVATPTFLRGYLKKAEPEQLESLKIVVTGAEKLPRSLAEQFEARFGKPVLEGYGLTETSPVTNVNLPDPVADDERHPVLPSQRPGSVGHLIPGMAVRITDPDTDRPIPLDQTGMIWLKGPNVFGGYLNNPEQTAKMLFDGWLRTGDIGHVDHEGFLYIDGRISRFSKIAGEMVPHETVEAAISRELQLDGEGERRIAIVGVPDESKGEQLVLLSAVHGLDPTDLRYRLLERGIPSLWIPRVIIDVLEIPHLASGKLNLKACQTIAQRGEDDALGS
jgi:acyl-[acyl-carrier-protein]-phospholipid O-acyltransferase/long-chain-fatty-acid--[acyl-carrier-protein] ligase